MTRPLTTQLLTGVALASTMVASACSPATGDTDGSTDGDTDTDGGPTPDTVPEFDASNFSDGATVDNAYFPLEAHFPWVYFGQTEEDPEAIVVEVLDETRKVAGIDTRVVRDRVFVETVELIYDDEGKLIDEVPEGAWEAGKDVADIGVIAEPGILMQAKPTVGDSYYQEFYEGEADDMGYVVATGIEVELDDGTPYEDCLQTLDWVPLEPFAIEYKFYAPGVGVIKEIALAEPDEAVFLVK